MRALRLFLITVVVAVLLAGTAYGAGRAYRHLGDESASSSPTRSGEPAPETTPTTSRDLGAVGRRRPRSSPWRRRSRPPCSSPAPRARRSASSSTGCSRWPGCPRPPPARTTRPRRRRSPGSRASAGFKATGVVDKKTWTKLVAMTKTPTHDQKFNVLKPGPALLAAGDIRRRRSATLQARLKQIAWLFGDVTGTYDATTVAAVKGFQAKRAIPVTGEIDQRTMDRLHLDDPHAHRRREAQQGAEHRQRPSARSTRAAPTGRALCVDKSSSTVRWVVDGKVQRDVRRALRLRRAARPARARSRCCRKSRDHVSTLYHTSMPFAMFFSGGQAVHYSPDFAAHGYDGASTAASTCATTTAWCGCSTR